MSRPYGYSLDRYGWLIDEPVRMDAYVEALKRAVKPGDVVFDIGAGPGAFAILACRFGASKAVAIESDPAVQLALELARAEGCADKIEVFAGISTEYEPSIRADVIVSDLRGNVPVFEQMIPSVVDARERLLKPGGIMIPANDRLWLGLIESDQVKRKIEKPWSQNRFGLDLSAGRRFIVNSQFSFRFKPDELIAVPQMIQLLDYSTITEANLSMPFEFEASRGGDSHGLAMWFETQLYEDIGYGSSPQAPSTIYAHVFFPFEQPMALARGDRVEGELIATLSGGQYTWSWRTSFHRQKDARTIGYRQSTGFGAIFSADQIAIMSDEFVPPPSAMHEVDRFILEGFDGKQSLVEIAASVRSRFAERFGSEAQAIEHVRELAARYQST